MSGHKPPEHREDAFSCPFCGTFAHQNWTRPSRGRGIISGYDSSKCQKCNSVALWVEGKLVYPSESPAPRPAPDMPEEIEQVYQEARDVVSDSPRAAGALLRLAVEMLLEEVGAEGDGPYNMIGDLVDKGRIDPKIQKAYDSLRVYGNESVHPGTIDLSEDQESALQLFRLMNYIVHRTITEEEFVEAFYDENVPENKKDGVEQRDG